jgi:N-acetylmuramoyl-L-alanine amidase
MKMTSRVLTLAGKRFLLLLCVAGFAYGCAGGSAGRGPISITGNMPGGVPHDVYHTVGPSETVWRISKTYGVDMNSILRANQITDPTRIKNGQRLLIPNTTGPRPMIPLFPTRRWTHIVIHHTATHDGDAFSLDQLHHKRGFWNGLGYHFLVNNGTKGKLDGQIQVGPRWIKQMDGAHANAAGMNEKGIGVAVVGNFSEKRITQAEFESLVFLVKTLKDYYRIPSSNILRHNDVPGKNTECPGIYFPWADFKRRVG